LIAQNQYTCDVCGSSFDTKNELEEHNHIAHSLYKCQVCGEAFDSESELKSHNLVMHPERRTTPKVA